jgi:hypothetical protein
MDTDIIRNALQVAYDKVEGDYVAFENEFNRFKEYWVPSYITEFAYQELFGSFFVKKAPGDKVGYELDSDEFDEEFVNGVSLSKIGLAGWFDELALGRAEKSAFCYEFLNSRFGLKGELRTDVVRNAGHILSRLNNPLDWQGNRNGLVYGMVQSGKTNSMLALTTLAFFQGFDIVIVLTTNSIDLRSQTQIRFNKLFNQGQGICECDGIKIKTSTSLDDKIPKGSDPFDHFNGLELSYSNGRFKQFLVLKKETRTLSRYVKMFQELMMRLKKDYQPKVLILDDEADHSSINTKKLELSPINSKLSELVEALGCADYVAYTATPQGCIAADFNATIGYPRDFIWVLEPFLPRVDNKLMMGSYVGGYEVFHKFPNLICEAIPNEDWPLHRRNDDGKYSGVFAILPESEGMSLRHAEIDYVHAILANRVEVPQSMVRMLIDFLITGGEMWRSWHLTISKDIAFNLEDAPYFSCLFNPTYIKDTQINYAKVIDLAWQIAKDHCKFKSQSFLERLRHHEVVSSKFGISFDYGDLDYYVNKIIEEVDRAIVVRDSKTNSLKNSGEYLYVLNSQTPFNLDYTKKDATAVKRAAIVIGGNKLSRGLTIEGLACAYYGRTQKVSLADTVTQMARWFGHKSSYLHLLRVYMHVETFEVFREISYEDLRLRLSIKRSISEGESPADTLIEILESPLYKATNPSKARNLKSSGRSDYSRNSAIHKRFRGDIRSLEHNVRTFDNFVAGLTRANGKPERVWSRGDAWMRVTMEKVLDFLSDLNEADYQTDSSPEMVVRYLEHWRRDHGELNFNVVHMRPENGGLAKRQRKGIPDTGSEDEVKSLVLNEFGSITGSTPDRSYLGDRFIDFSEHKGKTADDLQKLRQSPLLLIYELDPNYICKKPLHLSFSPGEMRHIDLKGRGIIVYALMMPTNNRPRWKGLYNSTVPI